MSVKKEKLKELVSAQSERKMSILKNQLFVDFVAGYDDAAQEEVGAPLFDVFLWSCNSLKYHVPLNY